MVVGDSFAIFSSFFYISLSRKIILLKAVCAFAKERRRRNDCPTRPVYTFLLLPPLSAPSRAPTRSVLHLDLSSAVPEAGGAHARPRYPFLSLSPTRIARGCTGNEASFHHRSIPLWQALLVRRSGHIDASGHGGTSVSRLHCSSTRPSSSACEDVCALYRARTRRGWKPPSGSGAPVCPLPATYSRFFYPSLIRIC